MVLIDMFQVIPYMLPQSHFERDLPRGEDIAVVPLDPLVVSRIT
jgi:hypothetical protein